MKKHLSKTCSTLDNSNICSECRPQASYGCLAQLMTLSLPAINRAMALSLPTINRAMALKALLCVGQCLSVRQDDGA